MNTPIQAHVDRVVMDSGKDIVLTIVCSRRFRDECAALSGVNVSVEKYMHEHSREEVLANWELIPDGQ